MRNVASGAPNMISGELVIPAGLMAHRSGVPNFRMDAAACACIERIAMQAVFDAKHALGNRTKDVFAEKYGWDITAYVQQPEGLAFKHHIKVKGRAKGRPSSPAPAMRLATG